MQFWTLTRSKFCFLCNAETGLLMSLLTIFTKSDKTMLFQQFLYFTLIHSKFFQIDALVSILTLKEHCQSFLKTSNHKIFSSPKFKEILEASPNFVFSMSEILFYSENCTFRNISCPQLKRFLQSRSPFL